MRSQENSDFANLRIRVQKQLDSKLPFVLYRKPDESKVAALFQNMSSTNTAIDYEEQGFLFAPFDSSAALILKPDEELTTEFEPIADFSLGTEIKDFKDSGREEHIELAQKAIDAINMGSLQKVIASRKIEVQTEKSALEIFEAALHLYGNSFCYLWYHPKTGIWLGATPEAFLKVNGSRVESASLAGTLKVDDDEKPNWSSKERAEQQTVTDFIYNCFAQNLENVSVSKPETVKAGNVWHLKSIATGEINDQFGLKRLIDDLHPTPAVCGYPKKDALSFIHNNECYNREYYTGFLGELNFGEAEKTNLFVNLRCMQLDDSTVSIFVGGGITSDSDLESEWLETQYKSQTMLSLL